jgi:hypothetical protein
MQRWSVKDSAVPAEMLELAVNVKRVCLYAGVPDFPVAPHRSFVLGVSSLQDQHGH